MVQDGSGGLVGVEQAEAGELFLLLTWLLNFDQFAPEF